jgi:hypothetical protein
MLPGCCIVNLSSQPADWIPSRILAQENNSPQNELATESQKQQQDGSGSDVKPVRHTCLIATKYFHAEIFLHMIDSKTLLESGESLELIINSTEAVVFYCDSTKDSFRQAELAWEKFKEVAPAICLCVVESLPDVVKGKFPSCLQLYVINTWIQRMSSYKSLSFLIPCI